MNLALLLGGSWIVLDPYGVVMCTFSSTCLADCGTITVSHSIQLCFLCAAQGTELTVLSCSMHAYVDLYVCLPLLVAVRYLCWRMVLCRLSVSFLCSMHGPEWSPFGDCPAQQPFLFPAHTLPALQPCIWHTPGWLTPFIMPSIVCC